MFDLARLFAAVDAQREQRGLSWAALSREVGVAASTIRRFGQAADAEADGVLALVRWLRVAPEAFISGNARPPETLPVPGVGVVRVDMRAVGDAVGDRRSTDGRTRTTIQRLVAVAQESSRTVASLTRLSEV